MHVQTLVAPFRFEAQEAPAPEASELHDGEVILQVLAGAICGSDLPRFNGSVSRYATDLGQHAADVPGFPLHEVVGEVIESNGTDLALGQRVVGWAKHTNGLSEQIVGDANELWTLESEADAGDQVMIQPLACVLYALEQLGDINGRRAAVIGQGPIGLLFSHALHALGASHVTGIDRVDRSDIAASFGIDDVIATSSDRWARGLGSSDRPDIVIEAVGHQTGTLNHAVEAIAPHGDIYYFGIADEATYPFDVVKFQRKYLSLHSGVTPTPEKRRMLSSAEGYLKDHPELARAYNTNRFSLADTQMAFECAYTPAPSRLKVVITPN